MGQALSRPAAEHARHSPTLPRGACYLGSSTEPKTAQPGSRTRIMPFYASLTAYEGHKISTKVIYFCFKAPFVESK